jgi:hypothetical protein
MADTTPPTPQQELWEERAAIMEYCGGLTRAEAETLAWACVGGGPAPGGSSAVSLPADQQTLTGFTSPLLQDNYTPRGSRWGRR